MNRHLLVLLLCSILLLIAQATYAQCTGCTYTATSGGNYNLGNNEKVCITSNVSNLSFNFNGSSTSICVGTGVTWTQTNGFNPSGLTIDVYGTFSMSGNYNFNGATVINVRPGGVFTTSLTGFGSNLTVNNYGTTTFTTSSDINNQGSFIFNNFAGATLNAPNTTRFFMNTGTNLYNYGTVTVANLENQDANIQNYSTGILTVGRNFNNHGNFINNGTTTVPCTSGTSTTCAFIVGSKGITNNSCMKVTGDVTFNGPSFIYGTLEVVSPNSATFYNLTLNATVSGTNGRIIVDNGTSTINSAGLYTGTNMKFCDVNNMVGTTGQAGTIIDARQHAFDVNVNQNQASSYTIDCSANTCSGTTTCASSLTAAAGSCTPATNQYALTGTISLTSNSAGGTLTVTDGSSTTTVTVAANATTASFSLTGISSNGSSHTVTASLPGCTTATQTYTAPASCSCASLSVTASRSSSAICQGQSVTLSAQVSPTGSYTYTWAGNGTMTNGSTATATILGLPTGTNTFTVTVRSSATCSTTATTTVTVNALPTASLTSATICNGTTASLTATGGMSYTFSTGLTNTTGSFTVSPSIATNYTVVVTSDQGCSATATSTVTVNPTPILTLNSPTACTSQSTVLSATGCSGTLTWATGDQTASLTVAPLTTTTYSLTCVLSTGCSGTVSTAVTVTGAPSYTRASAVPVTCTGENPNSNGHIDLAGLVNVDRAGISQGSTYAGPVYGSSQVVSGTTVSFGSLANPNRSQPYTVRLFGSGGTCFTDITVILDAVVCKCSPSAWALVVLQRMM